MTQTANPEWWTKAIEDRMRFLFSKYYNPEFLMLPSEYIFSKNLIEAYNLGPRHEKNRTGRLHADLINLTDKYGYKEAIHEQGKPV